MIKEECLKALDCLYDDVLDKETWGFVREGDNLSCTDVENAKKYYRDKIYNLINEHFDNPPFSFEELEIGKPYFDTNYNEWCLIGKKEPFLTIYFDETVSTDEFKENRFYGKEFK